MDSSISEKVTVGVLTSIIVGAWVAVRKFGFWVIGVRERMDKHDEQLEIVKKDLENHIKDEWARQHMYNEMSERVARIETKIDLLIDNKIK